MSDVVQSKVPLLVAGVSNPLVFGRKSLGNYVFVTAHRAPSPPFPRGGHVICPEITEEIVGILAKLHFRVYQFLVASPSSLLCVAIVSFSFRAFQADCPSPVLSSCRICMFELLHHIVGGSRCGKKQNAPEIMVRLSCHLRSAAISSAAVSAVPRRDDLPGHA